jgi:hypothetical protein
MFGSVCSNPQWFSEHTRSYRKVRSGFPMLLNQYRSVSSGFPKTRDSYRTVSSGIPKMLSMLSHYRKVSSGFSNIHEVTEQSAVVSRWCSISTEESAVVFRRNTIVPNSQQWYSEDAQSLTNSQQWFSEETLLYRTVSSGFQKRRDCTEQSAVIFQRNRIVQNSRQWFSEHNTNTEMPSDNKQSFLATEVIDSHVKV